MGIVENIYKVFQLSLTITEKRILRRITKKEQEKIVSQIKGQIVIDGKGDLSQRTGLRNEDIEILHITPTGLEIGGMPVNTLIGYKGRDIRLHFYASFAPRTYTEALRTVASSLGLEVISIVSQPFAVARAHSGIENPTFSAIFLDIGGGTTDVAVVKDGNIVETQMFAFGGRVFTKELASLTDSDFRHAEERKKKYANKELTKEVSRKVQKVMYSTANIWMRTLKVALESSEDVDVVPSQIYLCGGGFFASDIKEVMLECPGRNFYLLQSFKIEMFTPISSRVRDNSGQLQNVYDINTCFLSEICHMIWK
jgi:cell division protein FtsA